ncbi:hypothetical protein V6N13_005518 [Hibiscus sabdariffa]
MNLTLAKNGAKHGGRKKNRELQSLSGDGSNNDERRNGGYGSTRRGTGKLLVATAHRTGVGRAANRQEQWVSDEQLGLDFAGDDGLERRVDGGVRSGGRRRSQR